MLDPDTLLVEMVGAGKFFDRLLVGESQWGCSTVRTSSGVIGVARRGEA